MTTSMKNAYWDDVYVAYKAGDYHCDSCPAYQVSVFGYAFIPFCDGDYHKYVWGIFIKDATDKDDWEDTFAATKAELLREQIRAGLNSCYPSIFLPLIMND